LFLQGIRQAFFVCRRNQPRSQIPVDLLSTICDYLCQGFNFFLGFHPIQDLNISGENYLAE